MALTRLHAGHCGPRVGSDGHSDASLAPTSPKQRRRVLQLDTQSSLAPYRQQAPGGDTVCPRSRWGRLTHLSLDLLGDDPGGSYVLLMAF